MRVNLGRLFKVKKGVEESDLQLKQALEYNHKITETSPVGIVVVNKDGEIEFANHRAETTLGLKKSDITRLKYNAPEWQIKDFDGGEFPEEELPFMRVMNEGESVFNIRHAIEWPDKSMVYLSINASPTYNQHNQFDGMVATFEDITEQVLKDKQLKEINTFREMIIKNAAEGLCVCHNCDEFPYVNFTVWNEQIEKITGYTVEEINEKGWYQSLYKDEAIREEAIGRMLAMREGDDIFAEEWEITTKNNQKKTISISTSIINTDKGTTHVMALITDATQKKQQSESIRRHNEELKKRNETKDKFMSILSHDLKGPIGAQIELLKSVLEDFNECSAVKLRHFVEVMLENSTASYQLLENTLNWAKVQIGERRPNLEEFYLRRIIVESKELYSTAISSKELQMQIEVSENKLLKTDKNIIKTVLRNLISNAIKFTPQNGRIVIETKEKSENVLVSITDNGVGMSEKAISLLLSDGNTYTTRGTNSEKGTGLGLSICKDLLETLGGDIHIESKEGEGSCFSFSIPNINA